MAFFLTGFLAEGGVRRLGLICAKPRKQINFRASAQFFFCGTLSAKRKIRFYAQQNPGFCAVRAAIERHAPFEARANSAIFKVRGFACFLWLKVRPIDVKVTCDFSFRSLWGSIRPKT